MVLDKIMKKGQGAFEYILMLAGLLLVVLLILVVLQGTQAGTQSDVQLKKCYADLVSDLRCYSSGAQFNPNVRLDGASGSATQPPASCASLETASSTSEVTPGNNGGYCTSTDLPQDNYRWDCGDVPTNQRPANSITLLAVDCD